MKIVPKLASSTFLRLVVEDAEEPGADLRPPFEAVDRLDERNKCVLGQILGLVRRVAHTPRGPVEAARMFVNDRP